MTTALRLTACALVIVLTSACKKLDHHRHDKSQCKILSFIADGQGLTDSLIIGTFHYTSWGAPESITVTEPTTGNPNYYFVYDRSKRLVAYVEGWADEQNNDTIFHAYHKYVYQGDKIVGDTVFAESSIREIDRSQYILGKYYYDKYGRVSKYETVSYPDGGTDGAELNHPPYDPFKPNRSFTGTHPVLMFVTRDYRTENPALEYNSFGYPTRFSLDDNDQRSYYFRFHRISTVSYDCNSGWKKFY